MNLEITGKLIDKGEIQQIKDTFRKREFVLELPDDSGSQYINYAKMQLVQQKCELLDRFNEGDSLRVSFNIKGNRYERDGKTSYFSNLDAWRVEHADGGGQQGGGGNQQQQQQGGGGNQGYNQGGGNQGFNQNQGGGNGGWSNQGGGSQGGYANANQGGNAGGGASDDLPF